MPLKKATNQSEAYYYPKRPNSPLLKLGSVATKKKWGIARHECFEKNIFIVMNTSKSSTPAFDLAVLILRDSSFAEENQDIFIGLNELLKNKFTSEVALLFKRRIDKEKVFVKSKHEAFIDHYYNFIKAAKKEKGSRDPYEHKTREELIKNIHALESVLKKIQNQVRKTKK